jgi:hypothetical protein
MPLPMPLEGTGASSGPPPLKTMKGKPMSKRGHTQAASEYLDGKDSPKGVKFVGLEDLDPEEDDSELQDHESALPTADSPGDDAILEQEELYQGLSSDNPPSNKYEKES